jgi:predicted nucleic-acid-binding Zn-ribbon protein
MAKIYSAIILLVIFLLASPQYADAKKLTYMHTCSKCGLQLVNKKQTQKLGKCPKGGGHNWSHKQVLNKK